MGGWGFVGEDGRGGGRGCGLLLLVVVLLELMSVVVLLLVLILVVVLLAPVLLPVLPLSVLSGGGCSAFLTDSLQAAIPVRLPSPCCCCCRRCCCCLCASCSSLLVWLLSVRPVALAADLKRSPTQLERVLISHS